jgi:hypothetical protein
MEEAMKEFMVNITWDDESERWSTESEDIPGLLLEAGSLDGLIERVRFAVLDLKQAGDTNIKSATDQINLLLSINRKLQVPLHG